MASRGEVCRGPGEEPDSDTLLPPKKQLDQYFKAFEMKTQFFSTYHPDVIEEAVLTHLRNVAKVEPNINSKKYKLKFQLNSKDEGVENEQ